MSLKSRMVKLAYAAAFRLPPLLGISVRNRTLPWGRPTLAYLEFPLADHCNLNCAGCLHYAPMAERRLADIESVERDFTRLASLFSNIRQIRIMGGEPLLHPRADEAVRIVRAAFPRSRVSVVTNGLRLLNGADADVQRLLAAMAETGASFDWTAYPPVAGRADEIAALCKKAGVRLDMTATTEFLARILPEGGADVRRSFRWCRAKFFCPLLDDGRIYTCATARYADCYNKAARTNIPVERGLDIHVATARAILRYLMKPSPSCAFCAEGARTFAWKANGSPEDWLFRKEAR